jgi:hypothetical protein
VVSAADPAQSLISGLYTGAATFLSSSSSFILTRAEWTPFQTHCYSENLVTPAIEHGTSGLAARNSTRHKNKRRPSVCSELNYVTTHAFVSAHLWVLQFPCSLLSLPSLAYVNACVTLEFGVVPRPPLPQPSVPSLYVYVCLLHSPAVSPSTIISFSTQSGDMKLYLQHPMFCAPCVKRWMLLLASDIFYSPHPSKCRS